MFYLYLMYWKLYFRGQKIHTKLPINTQVPRQEHIPHTIPHTPPNFRNFGNGLKPFENYFSSYFWIDEYPHLYRALSRMYKYIFLKHLNIQNRDLQQLQGCHIVLKSWNRSLFFKDPLFRPNVLYLCQVLAVTQQR